MLAGIERWESHECNKPGQLRKDCSVYKKRSVENGNKPKGERFETTAAVRTVMVETWKYEEAQLYRWCISISMSFGLRV